MTRVSLRPAHLDPVRLVRGRRGLVDLVLPAPTAARIGPLLLGLVQVRDEGRALPLRGRLVIVPPLGFVRVLVVTCLRFTLL